MRDVLVVGNVGLDLLRDMAETVEAMGGVDQFQEIVAIEPQYFVLRDIQGQLWHAEEARLLTDEEVVKAQDIYAEIYSGNNTPEVAETAQEIWDETLQSSEISTQSFGHTLEDFAAADGSLDLKRVQQFVEGDAGISTQDMNRDRRR